MRLVRWLLALAVLASSVGMSFTLDSSPAFAAPLPISGAVKIVAGYDHTCILTNAGGVKCWGWNGRGQLGDGTTTNRLMPVDVTGLTSGVASISAGYNHTCALMKTGTVKCWGGGESSQLGDGKNTASFVPVDLSITPSMGVIALTSGKYFSCVLTSAGGVKCWGSNGFGQLGNNTQQPALTPVNSTMQVSVVKLAAGASHACAVKGNGKINCWGYNTNWQLGLNTSGIPSTLVPMEVAGFLGYPGDMAANVAGGEQHTCAYLTTGALRCWGGNASGQVGDGSTTQRIAPVDVPGISQVTALAAGSSHTCVLTTGSAPKCWGANGSGQIGDGTKTNRLSPFTVSALPAETVDIAAGNGHTCAIVAAGAVKCWGNNGLGQLGDGSTTDRLTPVSVVADGAIPPSLPAVLPPVQGMVTSRGRISANDFFTCGISVTGVARCVGANGSGQQGNGSTSFQAGLANVPNLGAVVSIVAGNRKACALTSAGGVKCWGWNSSGQLGDGSITDRLTPVDVSGLTSGVVAIAGGNSAQHTCAVLNNGTVKCWGANGSGQLGDGTTANKSTPVTVPGLTNVIAVAVGNAHTCALQSAGTVKCWGDNAYFQLGYTVDGTVPSLKPVPVGDLTNAVVLAAGSTHNCVITATGGLKCWGSGGNGELGRGQAGNMWCCVVPYDFESGVVDIAAGGFTTCAIMTTGYVKCFGRNYNGTLGNGTTTGPSLGAQLPIGLQGNTGAISVGLYHVCSLTTTGVMCWGLNDAGELNDGTTTARYAPVVFNQTGSDKITALVYKDLNGNGKQDANEPSVAP